MVKEKRILSYFIGWLIIGLFICFIGIRSTYAQIINYKYLDKSIGETFSISSNSSISANTFVNVSQDSTKKYLVIDLCSTTGSDISTSVTSNFDGSNTTFYELYDIKKSCSVGSYDGDTIRIFYLIKNWTDSGNGNLAINNTTKFTNNVSWNGSYKLLSLSLSDTIDLGDLSTNNQNIIINGIDNLNTSINNSTNTITGSIGDAETNINSNIQSTEDNINQNIDDMESAIVDSNKETQDVIKDQFNSCRDSLNLFNKNTAILSSYIDTSGEIVSPANNFAISDFINVNQNETYTYSGSHMQTSFGAKGAYYDENKNFISYFNMTTSRTITIPEGAYYIRFSLRSSSGDLNTFQFQKGSVATKYEAYGEKVCTNKIDETNDSLNNIGGALTDSSAPNTSGLENSAGWLPAGPLDSVLNLPLSLFNALTTNLNKSCNSINIPLPFVNKNITLPCINTLYNQIGITSFLSWIGVIVSGLMLYTYLLKLYKWIEDRISLNETHNVDSWGGL